MQIQIVSRTKDYIQKPTSVNTDICLPCIRVWTKYGETDIITKYYHKKSVDNEMR